MSSTRRTTDARRATFLALSSQIEGQMREAYDRLYHAGKATQTSLAAKLSVNKSAIHRRLTGRNNMTIETIADMVWALELAIKVEIFVPYLDHTSNFNKVVKVQDTKLNVPTSKTPSSSELPPELRAMIAGKSPTSLLAGGSIAPAIVAVN